MKSTASEHALEKLLRLCPRGQTTRKMMFGCPVLFVRGQMFAGIYKRSFFLRVGEDKKRQMISARKAKPFRAKGREMKQYITLQLPLDIKGAALNRLVRDALTVLQR